MPELPEIMNLSIQLRKELLNREIKTVVIHQDKILNYPEEQFKDFILNRTITNVTSKGKWIFIVLDGESQILMNLGMGANVLLHQEDDPLPEKYQFLITFDDNRKVSVNFWWFGHVHYKHDLNETHAMTDKIGIDPVRDLLFNFRYFERLVKDKRMGVKSFLLNQEYVAGIGNVYVQDILFESKLHPNRTLDTLDEFELKLLYYNMTDKLTKAMNYGGISSEVDLYNNPGRFDDFKVGYRAGEECPECGTIITKEKVASTASYICNNCQK